MAVKLEEWIDKEVSKYKKKSLRWLSEYYFNRCEHRASIIDHQRFFTCADGIIMGSFESISANESIIPIKGD